MLKLFLPIMMTMISIIPAYSSDHSSQMKKWDTIYSGLYEPKLEREEIEIDFDDWMHMYLERAYIHWRSGNIEAMFEELDKADVYLDYHKDIFKRCYQVSN